MVPVSIGKESLIFFFGVLMTDALPMQQLVELKRAAVFLSTSLCATSVFGADELVVPVRATVNSEVSIREGLFRSVESNFTSYSHRADVASENCIQYFSTFMSPAT